MKRTALIFAFAIGASVATGLVAISAGSGMRIPASASFERTWTTVGPDVGAVGPQLIQRGGRQSELIARAESLGAADAAAVSALRASSTLAQRLGLPQQGKFVHVVLEVRGGDAVGLADRVRLAGGRVEIEQGHLVQARVPASEIGALRADPGVVRMRPPAEFVPAAIIGEGVGATNASEWQPHGLVGTGVKVAVVDGGFAGLAEKQAAGEIPNLAGTADFCGGKFNGPDNHGTAVAEIVAEQAPGASMYLVCIDTDASLAQAEAYAKANGITIVNMSGGFLNTWRGDGNGPAGTPDGIVADARANGILWVNAAGNEAMSHWGGTFVSTDGDRFHDFVPGDEVNTVLVPPGNVVCGSLRWDEWPTASDDFDLGLYDSAARQFVAVSEANQSRGGLPPTEEACARNTSGSTREAGFAIFRYSGSGTPAFDLFVTGDPYALVPQYSTASRSITDPAASTNVLTAGADCWQTSGLEPYSSQGPTIDNRMKPDLVAPDSVSSATYGAFTTCGRSGFSGTSASSPYAAGSAAVLKQRYPTMQAADLQKWLVSKASDLGTPGADNQYGAGKLTLPTLPQAAVKAIAARGSFGRTVRLRFRLTGVQWQLREHVHVFRGSAQVSTFVLPFRLAPNGSTQSVTWKAPRAVSNSAFRFCTEAWDKAGHASKRSCARIALH